MKITKQELIEMRACKDGLNRFIAQTNDTSEPVEASSLIGGENTREDLIWLASKKLPKDRIVRFACDCATLNVELIKPHTNDYDMIIRFLSNPDDGRAARDASYDAACGSATYATRDSALAFKAVYYAANASIANRRVIYTSGAYRAASNAEELIGSNEKVNELLKELFA